MVPGRLAAGFVSPNITLGRRSESGTEEDQKMTLGRRSQEASRIRR